MLEVVCLLLIICGYIYSPIRYRDDIATFRGEIKILACELVKNYEFCPKTAMNKEAYKVQLISNVLFLLRGAYFLHNGVDENVSLIIDIQLFTEHHQGVTNNFCHPILQQLCLALFYSKSRVAVSFQQAFGSEIPSQTMALLATAVFIIYLLTNLTFKNFV